MLKTTGVKQIKQGAVCRESGEVVDELLYRQQGKVGKVNEAFLPPALEMAYYLSLCGVFSGEME